jgi:general secretion pathway protein C
LQSDRGRSHNTRVAFGRLPDIRMPLAKFNFLLIQFLGAALACAQLAYWSIRLMTPPAAPAPAPARTVSIRDPDPVLLARAFGQVGRVVVAGGGNIQVAGVFAAGADSAAVFVVDDRPARAVRLGQEVAPGSTLVDVDPHGVTLDSGGVRRQLRVPSAPMAGFDAAGRSAGFERRGNVLTAPTVDTPPSAATAPRPAFGRSPVGALAPREAPAATTPGGRVIGAPAPQ